MSAFVFILFSIHVHITFIRLPPKNATNRHKYYFYLNIVVFNEFDSIISIVWIPNIPSELIYCVHAMFTSKRSEDYIQRRWWVMGFPFNYVTCGIPCKNRDAKCQKPSPSKWIHIKRSITFFSTTERRRRMSLQPSAIYNSWKLSIRKNEKTVAMNLMVAMRPDTVITMKTVNCQQFNNKIFTYCIHAIRISMWVRATGPWCHRPTEWWRRIWRNIYCQQIGSGAYG